MLITRFAPSPTGSPHLGNIRTAFFAWILVKQRKGKFILRIEDTDLKRCNYKYVLEIIEALKWLGLDYSEGPIKPKDQKNLNPENWIQKGENKPYFQSQRIKIYKKYIDILLKKGLAYYCFCTKERLEKLRKEQLQKKQIPKYDGYCRNLSKEEVETKLNKGEKYVIRLKMPQSGETKAFDEIRGEIVFKNELQEDPILIKSDGFPTYHFASVIDDHLMGVNFVIRGDEWISSLPKHITLYKYFEWEIPKFIHLPVILGEDKTKLSKRHGAMSVLEYKRLGYLRDALLNFLVLLSWSTKDNREILSIEEIIRNFKVGNLLKSPPIFNQQKLLWLNGVYIRKLPIKEFKKLALPFLKDFDLEKKSYDLEKILLMAQTRIKVLSEIPEVIGFIFKLKDYNPEILIIESKEKTIEFLKFSKELIKKIRKSDFNVSKLREIFSNEIEKGGYNRKEILWPLRVSLSGKEKSPDVFEIMDVLGKEEVLNRIERAIKNLIN